jgi:hypothetical protein
MASEVRRVYSRVEFRSLVLGDDSPGILKLLVNPLNRVVNDPSVALVGELCPSIIRMKILISRLELVGGRKEDSRLVSILIVAVGSGPGDDPDGIGSLGMPHSDCSRLLGHIDETLSIFSNHESHILLEILRNGNGANDVSKGMSSAGKGSIVGGACELHMEREVVDWTAVSFRSPEDSPRNGEEGSVGESTGGGGHFWKMLMSLLLLCERTRVIVRR